MAKTHCGGRTSPTQRQQIKQIKRMPTHAESQGISSSSLSGGLSSRSRSRSYPRLGFTAHSDNSGGSPRNRSGSERRSTSTQGAPQVSLASMASPPTAQYTKLQALEAELQQMRQTIEQQRIDISNQRAEITRLQNLHRERSQTPRTAPPSPHAPAPPLKRKAAVETDTSSDTPRALRTLQK